MSSVRDLWVCVPQCQSAPKGLQQGVGKLQSYRKEEFEEGQIDRLEVVQLEVDQLDVDPLEEGLAPLIYSWGPSYMQSRVLLAQVSRRPREGEVSMFVKQSF
jgi:hypothetical protein